MLVTVRAETKSDEFGRHASGAGDVNRDGFADIIVGAPGNNANGAGAGARTSTPARTAGCC